MRIAHPPVRTELELAVTFDEATRVLAIATEHTPPMSLGATLAYQLTPAQAKELARALETWASRGV
jgi:hypothetical protein